MFSAALYARVHFVLCKPHTRPRVQRAPGLPCALCIRGREVTCKARAQCVARTRPHIQLSSPGLTGRPSIPETPMIESISRGVLDTPPSRVMTTERACAFSRRVSPEFCIFVCAPRKSRAQGRPGACCTRGLACDFAYSKSCTRAYRAAGAFRPSLRNGFTAYFVLSPENGSFASVAPEKLSLLQNLAPAPRRPNHTTSPYASGAYV